MRSLLFTTVLFTIWVVPCAQGQMMIGPEILSVGGARYRLTGVNGSFIAHPVDYLPGMLTLDQSLARCDELVAAIIERATPTGRKAPFVRDRTVPLRHDRTWVEYSQRHQGYRIVGGGGRIELDSEGKISSAGVQYESERFPMFKPKALSALARKAERAVPRLITGPAAQAELMIDPNGEAPARLLYFVVYPVRDQGHESGWQVSVDAVTGKVIRSATTMMQAAAAAE
jgi:hypothetical protein